MASILGVSRNAVYDAARRGDFRTIRVGKRILVPKSEIRRLLNAGPVTADCSSKAYGDGVRQQMITRFYSPEAVPNCRDSWGVGFGRHREGRVSLPNMMEQLAQHHKFQRYIREEIRRMDRTGGAFSVLSLAESVCARRKIENARDRDYTFGNSLPMSAAHDMVALAQRLPGTESNVAMAKPLSSLQPNGKKMTDARLTDELARSMGWRPFANRFLANGRDWIARSHFQPLAILDHAFQLLEKISRDYSIVNSPTAGFIVEVRLSGRVGRAAGEPKARTISLALARAIGLDLHR